MNNTIIIINLKNMHYLLTQMIVYIHNIKFLEVETKILKYVFNSFETHVIYSIPHKKIITLCTRNNSI